MITTIVLVGFLFILFSFYGIYVGLIKKKNKVSEAFASIDVQLKKRYSLIPNILTIAGKFMEHEKSLMTELTELRTKAVDLSSKKGKLKEKIALDKEISSKMGQLMVSVENYPQLKSDQTMVTAMQTYNEVEEHISAARRFYNSAVLELNNAVEIFPSSMIAVMCGIEQQEYFQVDEIERKDVNASDYLK